MCYTCTKMTVSGKHVTNVVSFFCNTSRPIRNQYIPKFRNFIDNYVSLGHILEPVTIAAKVTKTN